ncbi:hypothetical protein IVG45_21650 [Methylomonas sp. LL1]|uniref:anti-sigma factor family protein n=1 Tax=Methylomonas sp. LL1 TaxID=2785785 RepID=UPI0018C368D5|nr:zf-HC2 domain-containing protein [Methylomonas sp. LL1]QPK63372.1 hypothetical protein IVG45_21650 [Methylomonas sp. LL1]
MNPNSLQTADQHQQTLLLLPWYLNQSLKPAERQQVVNHLRGCMLCRLELDRLTNLAAAVRQASDLDTAAQASFDSLRGKLPTALPNRQQPQLSAVPRPADSRATINNANARQADKTPKRRQPFWRLIGTQGTRLAIAASLVLAIIPLAMHYGRSPTPADYYTLSAAKPGTMAGPQLRVVFSKSLSATDIDALLAQIHGQRMGEPNSVGAYTVRLVTGQNTPALATAIAFLRGQPDVVLAEPVLQP